MNSKYPSKIDAWVGLLLVLGTLVLLASAVALLFEEMPLWLKIFQLLLFAGLALLIVSLLINTNYTISNDRLLIRSGPIRWKIAIDSINLVEPSRKAWSSAALSLDRLYINYRDDQGVYISPKEKNAFMRDLASRSPKLVFEIDRVIKRHEGIS